jgi:hypothetical protein
MAADPSMADAWKFRSDSAGEPFETEITQHEPRSDIGVSAGQTVFSRATQRRPTPPAVFELYFDI